MSDFAQLNDDFRDMLEALVGCKVDFVIVGAHALAAHGLPRATGDIALAGLAAWGSIQLSGLAMVVGSALRLQRARRAQPPPATAHALAFDLGAGRLLGLDVAAAPTMTGARLSLRF